MPFKGEEGVCTPFKGKRGLGVLMPFKGEEWFGRTDAFQRGGGGLSIQILCYRDKMPLRFII